MEISDCFLYNIKVCVSEKKLARAAHSFSFWIIPSSNLSGIDLFVFKRKIVDQNKI